MREWRGSWLLLAWLFVAGVKLSHLHAYGGAMPITDMWQAEGELYRAAHAGTLSWRGLVAPHNEHRIAFTRLLDLALVRLTGRWDNRLQCVAGAALGATVATLLGGLAWMLAAGSDVRAGGSRTRDADSLGLAALALSAVAFATPVNQNDLIGFNTQYGFVLLFAVLTIWLLGTARPLSVPWWLGVLPALAGLFSAGSGLLASAAVAAIAAVALIAGRPGRSLPTLAVSAAVLFLGIALTVRVPGHQALHAQSLGDLLISFARGAAFPYLGHPALALVIWLPFPYLLARLVRGAPDHPVLERFLVGLGLWALSQAAAVAYSRGANGGGPDPRHLDLLKPALVVNGIGALLLGRRIAAAAGNSWPRAAVVAVWLLVAAGGLYPLAVTAVSEGSAALRSWCEERQRNVRAFVVSGESLDGKSIPFPEWGRAVFIGTLRDPYLRRILPAELGDADPSSPANVVAGSGPLFCAASLWGLLALYFAWGWRRAAPSPLERGGE